MLLIAPELPEQGCVIKRGKGEQVRAGEYHTHRPQRVHRLAQQRWICDMEWRQAPTGGQDLGDTRSIDHTVCRHLLSRPYFPPFLRLVEPSCWRVRQGGSSQTRAASRTARSLANVGAVRNIPRLVSRSLKESFHMPS